MRSMRPSPPVFPAVVLVVACSGAVLVGCGRASRDKAATQAAAVAPPPEVSVVPIETRRLPEYLEVTGRIEAVRAVDVRSRISGYLTTVLFRDGQFVKAGDRLYEIDSRPYDAQLKEAEGSLEKLLGEQRFNEVQVARYEKLSAKGAASMQEFDAWKAKREENIGAVAAARASVESARLNVEFCTIICPIDGQIGRTQLQVGNLINQDSTTLTTVVSIDPIFVYFNVDEPTLVRVLKARREESAAGAGERLFVDIGLVDDVERKYPHRCVVDFLNNQVDQQTATITMRGRLDNPYDPDPAHPKPPLFRAGMFIRARLPLGRPYDVLLVPETAVGSNQDRRLVWLVNADGMAVSREVAVGQKAGGWVAVRSTDPARPLTVADRVVVRGLQRCRDGKPVTAVVAPAGLVSTATLPASVDPAPDMPSAPDSPSAAEPEPPPAPVKDTAPVQPPVEPLPVPPARALDSPESPQS
jgi:RND family efflux transporter MFP subunit